MALRFLNSGTAVPSKNTRRTWNLFENFNFISAGQNLISGQQIQNIMPGDTLCVYTSKIGYEAIAVCIEAAVPIGNFLEKHPDFATYLQNLKQPEGNSLLDNAGNPNLQEYILSLKWKRTRSEFQPLFFNQNDLRYFAYVGTSCLMQKPATISAIANHFNYNLENF
jgi:hypothetical protein